MIVLAYLWPLALVPLLTMKQDADIQWHAKHGLVLMVAEVVVLTAFLVFTSLVSLAAFGLGILLSLLFVFVWLLVFVLHVAAILKAFGGSRLEVPGVSQYASRF